MLLKKVVDIRFYRLAHTGQKYGLVLYLECGHSVYIKHRESTPAWWRCGECEADANAVTFADQPDK